MVEEARRQERGEVVPLEHLQFPPHGGKRAIQFGVATTASPQSRHGQP
jgi:hypothetical protein